MTEVLLLNTLLHVDVDCLYYCYLCLFYLCIRGLPHLHTDHHADEDQVHGERLLHACLLFDQLSFQTSADTHKSRWPGPCPSAGPHSSSFSSPSSLGSISPDVIALKNPNPSFDDRIQSLRSGVYQL